MRLYLSILLVGVSLFSVGCGGGSMSKTTPPPTMYTVGGSVSGLKGTGLVLQNNSGDNLKVTANGSFTFPTAIASGSAYKVSVMTQPSSPTQNCVVAGGSGTANANITTVSVTCTTVTYTVGGTVSGLVGTGLKLQNNGGDTLPVTANGTFTFATPLDSGSAYAVSVMTQPSGPTQNCVVASGSGTANANITTVSVTCTTVSYSIGGTVSGLVGTGLKLQNNGGDTLPVTANGTFTFATQVDSGSGYNVSVLTHPSGPTQNCVVTNAGGTANATVTTVNVTCTTVTYSVGGTVVGLTGSGLALQNNGGDTLPVTANATGFTFATKLDGGSSYNVSVLTQPSNPTQSCGVTAGSGTSSVNVTNVLVTCSNINEWTWENGPQAVDQSGIYGTQGVADPGNVPGARYWSTSWSDASGNFWLFGGYGYDSIGASAADINDLWEGSPNSTGQWTWTWVGGAKVAGVGGTYGTLGVADPNNMPGARDSAVSWTDSSGNFWLFGGHGYDSTRTADDLNDLWKYSAGAWTWVSGSNVVDQIGTYGTLGTGDPSNVPGARYSSVSWVDKQGNFWLFGGLGYDSAGTIGSLNDLWEGSADSTGQWTWTWVSGSNVAGMKGIYSGSSAAPGARYLPTSWTDPQGNLWMFGGYGTDSAGNTANLSDLWEFNVTSRTWTWAGGLDTAGASGIYGTLGVAAPTNLPGSRKGAVSWTDATGNFWLFGGIGFDSAGVAGELNDLWVYNPTTAVWTWESGSNLVGQVGTYGTLGVGDPSNVPGARGGSPNWIDATGNLWLFGGNGPISGVNGSFSDLWKFVP